MASDIRTLVHDVRGPLNNISVNAELGKLTLERNGDRDKAIEVFETILAECRRCSDQLTHLRDELADESGDRE